MVSDLKLSLSPAVRWSTVRPSLNPRDTLVEMRACHVNILSLSLPFPPSVFLFSLALPPFDFLSLAFS